LKLFNKHITSKITILVLFVSIGFTQCKNLKLEQKTTPSITINNVTYHSWTGGQEPATGGIRVEFTIHGSECVNPDSLYFRGQRAKLATINYATGDLWIADYGNANYYNKPLAKSKGTASFPFQLKENEAMLSYYCKKKKYYHKITNIIKTRHILYP
jgi:hypothetical protein